MKWVSIITSAKQEIYELWQENQKLLSLIYNATLGTARVTSDNLKRTFHIGKEGFLKSKTVLRNEYWVKMGQLEYEKHNSGEGSIDMNGEKFSYTIDAGISTELHIRNTASNEIFVDCNISSLINNNAIFEKDDHLNDVTYPCLIMALCWYMFLPLPKENISASQFNESILLRRDSLQIS